MGGSGPDGGGGAAGEASERGLFVRNLDFGCTSADLEGVFESIGPIKSCFVVTEPSTGKSRGYG